MSGDKQIIEMADDIRRIRESYFGQADYLFAKKLYEDGYRKSTDVVSKSQLDQVRWERDVAIKQLEDIGLSFGEKTDGYGDLSENAKRIFVEIYKAFDNSVEIEHFKGVWFNFSKFKQRLAELKKKYTGKM